MRKPYDRILIISILLTVAYFYFIDEPTAVPYKDDQKNILFFGALYVALIFGLLSVIYLAVKKRDRR